MVTLAISVNGNHELSVETCHNDIEDIIHRGHHPSVYDSAENPSVIGQNEWVQPIMYGGEHFWAEAALVIVVVKSRCWLLCTVRMYWKTDVLTSLVQDGHRVLEWVLRRKRVNKGTHFSRSSCSFAFNGQVNVTATVYVYEI